MSDESDSETPADPGEPVGERVGERVGDEEGVGAAPDAVFSALWTKVLASWDDDKPHQAALSYAIAHEMLPEIAGRYRKLEGDPEKGARAKKKMDGIVIAATQLMLATKTPPREKVPWTWTASVAIVMVLVISFLAYKIFSHH
ncbi:MAG: hypothetical protein JWP87_5082 [Labilithrix sp.]|nr:hypothetical protein [Labilithrix sp.]